MRSCASYPRDVRHIFSFKALHLGHIAKRFGLRNPPSQITGIGKGHWVKKEAQRKNDLRREQKVIKAQEKRINQKALVISEFSIMRKPAIFVLVCLFVCSYATGTQDDIKELQDDIEELKAEVKQSEIDRQQLNNRLRYHDYIFVGFGVFIGLLLVLYIHHKVNNCRQANQGQVGGGGCFINAQHSNKHLGVSFPYCEYVKS